MKLLIDFLRAFILVLFCPLVFAQNPTSSNLSIYCEDDNPLQYFDKNKNLVGMTVEIVQEIQRRLGNTDPIQVVPWARGIYKLENEENVLLFTMARTSDREHLYQWIGPIISIEYGLFVKANSNIQIHNLDDAKKINLIGVNRNDIRDETLSKLGFTNLDRTSTSVLSFKKLMIDRISAYADAKSSVIFTATNAGYQISDVKLAFDLFKSDLYIAASKNTPIEVINSWNNILIDMKKDKTFSKIYKKYYKDERRK
jgi:polar amino acid transport system substrate-binding protein